MAKVILFGGGDGGGLIIGPNGVRPIPPFDLSLRLQLRGLSGLINGITPMPVEPQREMGKLVNRISNLIIEQVESVVGRLDEGSSLIYQDDDGGFHCGSTGKPPIPIPWPPKKSPSLSDLIESGVLERELVDFVKDATAKGNELKEILENPAKIAGKLDVQLSERTVQDLQRCAPSRVEKITNPVEREVLQFFHQVADDGRFLATWTTRPAEAATALNVHLSDDAFDVIIAGGRGTTLDPGSSSIIWIVVGIVVIIAVVIDPGDAEIAQRVRDRSGITKF